MLERLIKIYSMSMEFDVRSPMIHLVGPPGSGKSTTVQQLADLLGVKLHIINVSRLSPLEVEGVMMPRGTDDEQHLHMLPAVFWTRLQKGDVLLFDEFLAGRVDVFNAFLDIFTSRRVGNYELPPVFIIGASNTTVTPGDTDALKDRLLHLPVADPRTNQTERRNLAKIMVDALGLLPDMVDHYAMEELLTVEVLPTFNILDAFKSKGVRAGTRGDGQSLRKLIGQAQLREIHSSALKELLDSNNAMAMQKNKPQYVVLHAGGKSVPNGYTDAARQIQDNPRLSPLQAKNIAMNLQLVEMYDASKEEA